MNSIKNYTYRDFISIVVIIICIYIIYKYYSHTLRPSYIQEPFRNNDTYDSESDETSPPQIESPTNIQKKTQSTHKMKILITGSSNGIGLFLAIYLIKRGNDVVINGRNSKSLKKVVDKLQKVFPEEKIIAISADISTAEGCQYLLNTAIKELDGLDILINNASVVSRGRGINNNSNNNNDNDNNNSNTENDLLEKNKMDWEYEYRTIINGNLYLTQNFIKYIKSNLVDGKSKNTIKRIYTITSGAVKYDSNTLLHYNNIKIPSSYILCKSTVEKMCKLISNENTDSNIQIVVLRIDSTFDTNSTKFIKDDIYKKNMDDLIPYFDYFFNSESRSYKQNLNGKVLSLHDVDTQKNVLEFDINYRVDTNTIDNSYNKPDVYKLGSNPVKLPDIKTDSSSYSDLNKYPKHYNTMLIDFLVDYNNKNYGLSNDKIDIDNYVDRRNITLFPGILGCLEAVIDIFVPKRYQIISSKPGWEIVHTVAKKYDVDIMTFDIDQSTNYTIDFVKILKMYNGLTRIIYLIHPNYPFGIPMDRKRFLLFMNKIPNNIIVLVDLCYIEFMGVDKNIADISYYVNRYKNLICMKTVSKFYGLASLRIGYTISHPDITRVLQNYNINSSVVDAYKYAIVTQVLGNADFITRVQSYMESEKTRIYKILDNHRIPYIKSVTNYFCVYTRKKLYDIDTQLEKNNIAPYMNNLYLNKWYLFYIDTQKINNTVLSILLDGRSASD